MMSPARSFLLLALSALLPAAAAAAPPRTMGELLAGAAPGD